MGKVVFFVSGVLALVLAPQVVSAAGDGPVSPWPFVVGGEAGVIIGLVKYILPVDKFMSIREL